MLGIVLALIGFMLYSVGDIGFKFAGQTLNIYQTAFYAQAIGLSLLLVYSVITGKTLKTSKIKLHITRAACIAAPYFAAVYAFQHKSLAESYVFFYMSPFFTGLFAAYILKERFTKQQFLAVLTGFIGVLIILRPGFISFDWIGFAIILSSIFYSYASVITRRDGVGESELVFSFYTTLGVFIITIIPFVLNPVWITQDLILPITLAGACEATATGLVALACVKARAITVQKLGYTALIWAFLWGWLFFDDILVDIWTFTGGVIIISSGIYMIYRENKYSKNIT